MGSVCSMWWIIYEEYLQGNGGRDPTNRRQGAGGWRETKLFKEIMRWKNKKNSSKH